MAVPPRSSLHTMAVPFRSSQWTSLLGASCLHRPPHPYPPKGRSTLRTKTIPPNRSFWRTKTVRQQELLSPHLPTPLQKLLADNGCPVFLKLLSTDAHVGEGRERSEHRASPPSAVLSPRSCHHLHARPRRQRCYVFQQSSADTCRK